MNRFKMLIEKDFLLEKDIKFEYVSEKKYEEKNSNEVIATGFSYFSVETRIFGLTGIPNTTGFVVRHESI